MKYFLKSVKVSELMDMIYKSTFTMEIQRNKIKITDERARDDIPDESMNKVRRVDFRVIKSDKKYRILISLRDKFDANASNNRTLKDSELYPFLAAVPLDYKLYAENYQAEISV
jgi:hypothetical protein